METKERPAVDRMTESASPPEPAGARRQREPRVGLLRKLFKEGYRFDFFQALRLLEKLLPGASSPGERPTYREERIRIRPHNALAFPATDVKRIDIIDDATPRAQVTATFMGLYGVDSPLPVYFYDEIASDSEDVQPLRSFLDIFNHRLYAFFYRSWKKYRPALHYRPPGEDRHSERVRCLAGLGTRGALAGARVSAMRLAAFAGLLSARVRHAEGLQKLLSDALEDITVEVHENVPRWVPIPERGTLGGNGLGTLVLGKSATLGQRVFDLSGKFRLVLGPLTLEQYRALLPGAGCAQIVSYLVRLYVRDFLDFDVELRLRTEEIPTLRLGGMEARLGRTTWLGKPAGAVTFGLVTYE
jgi:type VI secretion system protein ImpH